MWQKFRSVSSSIDTQIGSPGLEKVIVLLKKQIINVYQNDKRKIYRSTVFEIVYKKARIYKN
jgi:hypothetical protein